MKNRTRFLSALIFSCIFTSILCIPSVLGSSQWNQTYGQTGKSIAYTVIQTAESGYVVGGILNKTIFVIIKVDSSGNTVWQKTFSIQTEDKDLSSEYNWAPLMIQTSDGGYAIGGTMLGKITSQTRVGDTIYQSVEKDRAFLLKLDSSANIQWKKIYSEYAGGQTLRSFTQTSDGGYAIVGIIESGGWGTIIGGNYFFETDSSGNLLNKARWNQIDYFPSDLISVVQADDTSYGSSTYLLLWDNSTLTKHAPSPGVDQWSQSYTWPTFSSSSIIQTNDGGYAITGNDEAGFSVIKIDSSGALQWMKDYLTNETRIAAHDLIQTSDGGFAVAIFRHYEDSLFQGTMNLVKTNAVGEIQWSQTYGNPENADVFSLIQTSDGGYVLAGFLMNYVDNQENKVFWLIKTDANGASTGLPEPSPSPTLTAAPTDTPSPSTIPNIPVPTESSSQSPEETEQHTQSPSIQPNMPLYTETIIMSLIIVAVIVTSTLILRKRASNKKK